MAWVPTEVVQVLNADPDVAEVAILLDSDPCGGGWVLS